MNSYATRKSDQHQPSVLPDRRVLFHDDVIVHCFEIDNDDDNDDDADQKRINSTANVLHSPPHQKHWTERKSKTHSSDQMDSCREPSNVSSSSSDTLVKRKPPPSSNSVPLPPEKTHVRYNLVRDRLLRQILLQFSIPLGPMYGPKGVMVKANLHGTKIRVMACSKKPTTTADGQTVKMEYNETFPLPFAVDPDRVTARVDNLGYLLIGAPILRNS